jgi:hypothetical protein
MKWAEGQTDVSKLGRISLNVTEIHENGFWAFSLNCVDNECQEEMGVTKTKIRFSVFYLEIVL